MPYSGSNADDITVLETQHESNHESSNTSTIPLGYFSNRQRHDTPIHTIMTNLSYPPSSDAIEQLIMLARSNRENAVQFCRAGAVPRLIGFLIGPLSVSDTAQRALLLKGLFYLSKNTSNNALFDLNFVCAYAIEATVHCFTHNESAEECAQATLLIHTMVKHNAILRRINAAVIAPKIIEHLNHHNMQVNVVTAGLMVRLTHSPTHNQAICRAGAIPSLLNVLASLDTPSLNYLQPIIIDAFFHLTRHVGNHGMLITSNLINTMLNLLTGSEHETQVKAARILSKLACSQDVRVAPQCIQKINQAGLLEQLLQLQPNASNRTQLYEKFCDAAAQGDQEHLRLANIHLS